MNTHSFRLLDTLPDSKKTLILAVCATTALLSIFAQAPSLAREKKLTDVVKNKIEAGEMFLFNGAVHDAIDEFKAAIALDKSSWQAHADLAQALTKIQDFYGAEDEYKEAVALNPKDNNLSSTLATLLYKDQKYAEAAAVFEKIQGAAADRDDVKQMMASCYLNGDKPEKAKALYLQMHERTPKNVDFVLGLAASYFKLGEVDRATKQIDQAIKDGVGDPRLAQLKGEMLETNGNKVAARESYELAIKANANNPEPFVSLGNLNLTEGNFNESSTNFENALKLQPENKDALLGLAYSQEHLGNLQSAAASFKKAASLESDNRKREAIFHHLEESQFANLK
jgi:Tfp pilus assembly protein PilF